MNEGEIPSSEQLRRMNELGWHILGVLKPSPETLTGLEVVGEVTRMYAAAEYFVNAPARSTVYKILTDMRKLGLVSSEPQSETDGRGNAIHSGIGYSSTELGKNLLSSQLELYQSIRQRING